jgi:hypothetical protein
MGTFRHVVVVLAFSLGVDASAQEAPTRLQGHLLPRLSAATPAATVAASPLTLTLVLRRDDEAGFADYLRDVYDPQSINFHKFLTAAQQSERFGPSPENLAKVSAFLAAQGLQAVAPSADRLIVSATASRADAERAFGVRIRDFTQQSKTFFANVDAPSLPADVAPHVSAVLGLTDLAHSQRGGALSQFAPHPPGEGGPISEEVEASLPYSCKLADTLDQADSISTIIDIVGAQEIGLSAISPITTLYRYQCAADVLDMVAEYAGNADGNVGGGERPAGSSPMAPLISIPSGLGQTVGLVEFDTYQRSDVLNYLSLLGHPERISQLTDVTLGAGANFVVSGEPEVLLDIDTVLSLAPGADVAEYDIPFSGQGSFQTVFNRMISDGVDVISNSYAYCEDQTSLADVQSLETVLQSAAVAGITVVTGSGDTGSTCLDGSANTIAVPAGSPSITAVGGTTATPNFQGTYGSEKWWDGSAQVPSSGQGGYGVSRFFTRPAYQNGASSQAMRSVPDVTAPADPALGVIICEADAGGCPTDYYYGGTSVAAPTWASLVAVMNQRVGHNAGFLNTQIYPLRSTSAFHTAASMGTDFAHVGLGSPNASELRRRLVNGTVGAFSATNSAIDSYPPNVYADGVQFAGVSVILFDANFHVVPGQTVTLTANAGSHATITTVNATSDASNGAAHFKITDLTAETVTLTPHVGATTINKTATVKFAGAPAASGGLQASPLTQTADGATASTVTVTLLDGNSNPATNKFVRLAQSGNSLVIGDNPAATGASGQATFQVVDQVQETVTYTAVDETDFGLVVPGSAQVTYVAGPGGGCGSGATPLAGPGYALSVYAAGFPVQNNTNFGGITLQGCGGVSGIAFDAGGNMYASDYVTGDVYKFAPGGGTANATTKLTPTPIGTSLGGLAFGGDHNLYAARVATANNATSGAIYRIDTGTGTATMVASGMPCPSYLTADPLSGDLFIADFCFGNAQQSADILRMPPVASPTVTTYATSSLAPNGALSFASDGTLYAVYGYPNFGGLFAGVDVISGTNGPATPTVVALQTVTSSFGLLAYGSNGSGGAKAVISSVQALGGYAHSVGVYDMTTSPPSYNGVTLVQSDIGSEKILGPDNCVYFVNSNVVYRLTNADGSCPLNNVAPDDYIVLAPQANPATAAQGTIQRFNVGFPHHPDLALGSVAISVLVSGPNSQVKEIPNGFPPFTTFGYSGLVAGTDTITVSATVNGTLLRSNPVTATWTSGKHTTFIDLNNSAVSQSAGSSVRVKATLYDNSVVPTVPVASAALQFTLGGQTCSATTNASGIASCLIALPSTTDCTLEADFAGDANYVAASSTEPFFVSKYDVLFANGFEYPGPAGCFAY